VRCEDRSIWRIARQHSTASRSDRNSRRCSSSDMIANVIDPDFVLGGVGLRPCWCWPRHRSSLVQGKVTLLRRRLVKVMLAFCAERLAIVTLQEGCWQQLEIEILLRKSLERPKFWKRGLLWLRVAGAILFEIRDGFNRTSLTMRPMAVLVKRTPILMITEIGFHNRPKYGGLRPATPLSVLFLQ